MPALLYTITETLTHENYQLTDQESIKVVGWDGLIHAMWEKRKGNDSLSADKDGIGWEISRQEIDTHVKSKKQEADRTDYEYRIVFDIQPYMQRTNLKAIAHIYLFTHNYKEEEVYWTVLMIRIKDNLFSESKALEKKKFTLSKNRPASEHLDFLYVRGDDNGWNWGTLGRMNGALIEPEARKFFKPFF